MKFKTIKRAIPFMFPIFLGIIFCGCLRWTDANPIRIRLPDGYDHGQAFEKTLMHATDIGYQPENIEKQRGVFRVQSLHAEEATFFMVQVKTDNRIHIRPVGFYVRHKEGRDVMHPNVRTEMDAFARELLSSLRTPDGESVQPPTENTSSNTQTAPPEDQAEAPATSEESQENPTENQPASPEI